MKLIDQKTKKIMEECKERARDSGLKFDGESLEYIVTNKDLLELSSKNMIPTLYDYWLDDVKILRGEKIYEIFPDNPYETVINTMPAISFYNDNNPDWMNIMIFYHVLGHLDFFQNNFMFKHTRKDDFCGQALADKRLINKMKSEHGKWVDYAIESTLGIDNLVNYYNNLSKINLPEKIKSSEKIDYYFDIFLQDIIKVSHDKYLEEIERYNQINKKNCKEKESIFFSETTDKYPEFESIFKKHMERKKERPRDVIEFLMENSKFLNKDGNEWIKSVMQIIRNTSMYFQPQMRTKIFNEGWASYWHEKLFLKDERIKGHEVDFAKIHSKVTSLNRVGLNPYAIGMRIVQYLEDGAERGKFSREFEKIREIEKRKNCDKKTGLGREFIFNVRENFNDFTLINTFVDEEFVNAYNLFIVGKRLNPDKEVWEYYIKSKKSEDYKKMLLEKLYHPPFITIDESKTTEETLYLKHYCEGKELIKDFIPNTMIGIGFLWDGKVKLDTTEVKHDNSKEKIKYQKVIYTLDNKKVSKEKFDLDYETYGEYIQDSLKKFFGNVP